MIKYIIVLPNNSYVKNSRNDTTNLQDAKIFDTYVQAERFVRCFCGSCTSVIELR
jgi:hypothetical protein